jgi:hypothetical protein
MIIFTTFDNRYQPYTETWKVFIQYAYPQYKAVAKRSEYQGFASACERYLYEASTKEDVYITDIDMMILREDPEINNFHLLEMVESGLSYSNTPRDNKEPRANERLTGLHYCTPRWYDETRGTREAYSFLLRAGKIGVGRYDDEIMLKQICLQSGLKIPPKRWIWERQHGIHLGVIRNYKPHGKARVVAEMRSRVKPEQARQWVEVSETPEYKAAKSRITDKLILWEFDFMDTFCRSQGKQE